MEIEAKAKVDNLEKARKIFESKGAKFRKAETNKDHYFKPIGKEREIQRPDSFILRVRESKKNFLTFKALTEQTGNWVEHEVEIDNPAEMRSILEKAGFSNIFSIVKERRKAVLDGIEICLDDIEGLGKYVEFSMLSGKPEDRKKLTEYMRKQGFSKIEARGYAAIISQNMGIKFEGTRG